MSQDSSPYRTVAWDTVSLQVLEDPATGDSCPFWFLSQQSAWELMLLCEGPGAYLRHPSTTNPTHGPLCVSGKRSPARGCYYPCRMLKSGDREETVVRRWWLPRFIKGTFGSNILPEIGFINSYPLIHTDIVSPNPLTQDASPSSINILYSFTLSHNTHKIISELTHQYHNQPQYLKVKLKVSLLPCSSSFPNNSVSKPLDRAEWDRHPCVMGDIMVAQSGDWNST